VTTVFLQIVMVVSSARRQSLESFTRLDSLDDSAAVLFATPKIQSLKKKPAFMRDMVGA